MIVPTPASASASPPLPVPLPPWLVIVALVVASAAIAPFEYDHANAWMRATHGVLSDHRDLLTIGEQYPSTWGIIFIGALMFLLDHTRRDRTFRYLLGLLTVGLLNGVLKIVFNRLRPPFDRRNDYVPETEWFKYQDWNWFCYVQHGTRTLGDADYWSYPSGHTCAAVFTAMTLTRFYPRGWPVWWFLALTTMAQRFTSASHYPADLLAGTAVGLLFYRLVVTWPPLMRAEDSSSTTLARWLGGRCQPLKDDASS